METQYKYKQTKSMIFNKTGKLFEKYNFIYLNSTVENVNSYKYLGIEFKTSGSFTSATNLLKEKASKALYVKTIKYTKKY